MAGRRAAPTRTTVAALALVALALQAGLWAERPLSAAAIVSAATTDRQLNRHDPASALAAGKILVAARTMGDPNFAETVILLFSCSKDGAAGLIVNRRTPVPLDRVLPDLPVPKGPRAVVFLGGPVSMSGIRALVRSPADRGNGYRVLSDVYLLGTLEALTDALEDDSAGGDRIRLYAGYAGWGAGQLEREVRIGAWHVFDGQGDLVFDLNPETLWARQIRLTEMLAL
jgi:putative transcriptional regulator